MRFYRKFIVLILTIFPLLILSAESKEIPTTHTTKTQKTESKEITLAFLDNFLKRIKKSETQPKKEQADLNLENEFLETPHTKTQDTSDKISSSSQVTDQSLEEEFEHSQKPLVKKEVPEITNTVKPREVTLPSLKDLPEETGNSEATKEEAVLEIPKELEEVSLPSLEDLPEETEKFEAQATEEDSLSDTTTESEEITRPSLEEYAGGTEQLKSQLIKQLENKNNVGSKDQGLKQYLNTKTANSKKKYDFQDIELHVVGQHEDTVSNEQIKRDVSSSDKTSKTIQK